MKIAVLAGGNSGERDVSWASGCKISNALADVGHAVALVDVWLGLPELDREPESLFLARPDYQDYAYQVPRTPPNLARLRENRIRSGSGYFGVHVLDLCRAADVAFIALHGAAGENGQLQAAFDLLGIPYTGSDFADCVIAMDKQLSKNLIRSLGCETPDWLYYRTIEEIDFAGVREKIGFPCVVKPPRGGSSIGVSIPNNEAECAEAIRVATTSDKTGSDGDVLIERFISGREFSVGILDGKPLPPIEIIPQSGWFDYESKYQSERTREVCPAEIPDELSAALQSKALRIHQGLRLGYYSRIDFRVDDGGTAYCLEANTLPGMTPGSLLPKEAAAAGIAYADLCNRIAVNAIFRDSVSS